MPTARAHSKNTKKSPKTECRQCQELLRGGARSCVQEQKRRNRRSKTIKFHHRKQFAYEGTLAVRTLSAAREFSREFSLALIKRSTNNSHFKTTARLSAVIFLFF